MNVSLKLMKLISECGSDKRGLRAFKHILCYTDVNAMNKSHDVMLYAATALTSMHIIIFATSMHI